MADPIKWPCIKKGSTDSTAGGLGYHVTWLQGFLENHGYGPNCVSNPGGGVSCDWNPGVFDDDVKAAVKEFQRAKGLSVDGIVGPDTWEILALHHSDPTWKEKYTAACTSGVWETITSTLLPDTVADADVPEDIEMKLWDSKFFWPAVAVGVVGIGIFIYRGQK